MKKDPIDKLRPQIKSEMAEDLNNIKKLDEKVNELSSKWHGFKKELVEVEKDLSYTITEDEILRATPKDRTEKLKKRERAMAKKAALESYISAAEEAIDRNKKLLEQRREEFSKKLRSVIVAQLEPARKEIASELIRLVDKDKAYSDAIYEICNELLPEVGIEPSHFFMFPGDFSAETHPLRMVNIRSQAKHYAESILQGKAETG